MTDEKLFNICLNSGQIDVIVRVVTGQSVLMCFSCHDRDAKFVRVYEDTPKSYYMTSVCVKCRKLEKKGIGDFPLSRIMQSSFFIAQSIVLQ